MSGIFPNSNDGGLPPNTSDPQNPTHAYPPVTDPTETAALYYGNGCDVRLRPEVVNSLISEIEAIADRAQVSYRASRLTNAELAIRYIVQRGLPKGTGLTGGPNSYNAALDPTMTAYNNYMVLAVVPQIGNAGAVRLNVDGKGPVPVFRNDGLELRQFDWGVGVPQLIGYYNGAFYMLGLVASQVYLRLPDTLNIWVRTDGNDATADGTVNTPAKAYRTLQAAWNSLSTRFVGTPTASVNFYLGIPGTYENAVIGPFGNGWISITGDVANMAAYRIKQSATNFGTCISLLDCNCLIQGVTFQGDNPVTLGNSPMLLVGGTCQLKACRFDYLATHPGNQFIQVGGYCSPVNGTTIEFRGNGHPVTFGILLTSGGQWGYPNPTLPAATLYFDNIGYVNAGIQIQKSSGMELGPTNIAFTNVSGCQFGVGGLSFLMAGGHTLPGTVAGVVDAASFGYYTP
jgi:hypothetical protein